MGIWRLVLQFYWSFLKFSHKRNYCMVWQQSHWILANHSTHVVLDLGCTRSTGWRAAIKRFQKRTLYHGVTTEFCPCNTSFVFANSETETCWENCIIHLPTTPPCSTRVGRSWHRWCAYLIFSSSDETFGNYYWIGPKRRQNYMSVFWLILLSSWILYYGHIVLDLTSLAYQPKSRERSAHLKRHVTFALSEQKSAYPAHARELDEDDDDKPLVCPDNVTASEDEDDEPLVRPSSKTELIKEKRDSAAERSIPTSLRRRKGLPVWRDPSAPLEQDVSGNSRERSEEVSILGRNSDAVKLFATS